MAQENDHAVRSHWRSPISVTIKSR